MEYTRVVSAALAETSSKFALAEALALDIPPQRRGPTPDGEQAVTEYLAEAREAILASGGEPRSVGTLREYRLTALWVCGGTPTNFGWAAGLSFTAHNEARKAGLSYEGFAADPITTDEIRRRAGKATTDGPPQQIVRDLAPDQKVQVARELLEDEEVARQVVSDPPTRARIARQEHEIDQEQQEIHRERQRLHEPRPEIGSMIDLEHALSQIRQRAEDALAAAERLESMDWPGDSKDRAIVLTQRAAAAVEQVKAKIEGRDLDEELADLLRGDA